MEKLLAATGVAALGAVGLLVTAVPAQAAPTMPPVCDSLSDQAPLPTEPAGSDWYSPCVPQFGYSGGKAEADLDFISANAFPDAFDPDNATVTTDFDDAAASDYIGETVTNGFTEDLTIDNGQSGPNEQVYRTKVVFQIAGVSPIDPNTLPSQCDGVYNSAYRVDYIPRTITFAQEIDGTTYRFQGTVGADPLLIGANLADTPDGGIAPSTSLEDGDICSAVGVDVVTDSLPFLHSSSPTDVSSTAGVSPFVRLYSMDFDTQGGNALDSEDVPEGSAAAEPADPTRDGYTFAGWFTKASGGTQWDFGSPVESDMTLFAQWTINEHTVSFDSQQGSAVKSSTVDFGSPVAEPADPTRDGYMFAGWFTKAGGGTQWDFATPVKADTTLYAKWDIDQYTVSFDAAGGSAVDSTAVDFGSPVAEPADPTRDGYTFAGWFTKASGGSQWDFATPVKADTTLFAHWETVAAAAVDTVEPATAAPELAATGSDFAGWSLAGLALLLLGAAAMVSSLLARRHRWGR